MGSCQQQVLLSKPGTPQSRCTSTTPREWWYIRADIAVAGWISNKWKLTAPKKIYMEPTFQATLCLMLSNIRQSKRQFVSPLRNVRVDQPMPSCGRLSVEHQSRSSPLRVILQHGLPHTVPHRSCWLPRTTLQPSHLYHYNYSAIPYISLCAISYSSLPLPYCKVILVHFIVLPVRLLRLAPCTMPCIH